MERAIRWQYPGKQYRTWAEKSVASEVKQINRAEKANREDKQLKVVSYLVVLAAVVCVVFSFFVPDITEDYSIPAWSGVTDDVAFLEVTASNIYSNYCIDSNYANSVYLDNRIRITGVIANWGVDDTGRSYITLYSDEQGSEGILCLYALVIDLERMKSIHRSTIEISGICAGFTEGKVILNEAFSESIPTTKDDLG